MPNNPFSSWINHRRKAARESEIGAEKLQKEISALSPVFERYSLDKVYLFGSVQKLTFHKDSDIDLYVENLEADQFWNLWRDLEESLDHPVDLYYQSDDPVFIEKIKDRGKLIYES